MTEITDLSPTDSSNTSVTGESLDGSIANMGRMDNTLQAVMGMLARSIRTNIMRVLDNVDPTKKLAFDLSGLTTATTRTLTVPNASGTIALTATSAGKTDVRRNRVVNGDKLVSQENAQNSGTTNGRYISDQNAMYFVSSAGVFTGVNVQTLSPAGGYRDRITITTADASLAAGEYLTYTQNVEGSNIRDAKWGTAAAVPIIVRRGFKFPAGTYTVAFHNSAVNRSYVTSFVVSVVEANTDIVREFAIPGDTSGTWLSADGVIGLVMDVVIAAGTTYQTTANAWQGGNFLTIAGSTNGIGTAAAVFEFFDEGLKLDPDATGAFGVYQAGEADFTYNPKRYVRKSWETGTPVGAPTNIGLSLVNGLTSTSSVKSLTVEFGTEMAKQPTLSYWDGGGNASRIRVYNGAGSTTDNIVASGFVGFVSRDRFSFFWGPNGAEGFSFHWLAISRLS